MDTNMNTNMNTNTNINMKIEIRKAAACDAQVIYNIIKESFKKYVKEAKIPVTIDALEENIEDVIKDIESKEVFIAFLNGIPAGTIRVETITDDTAIITRFGVLPEYQNNGIGRALLNHTDNFLISKGIKKVYLYTASKHANLIRFYYNTGFYVDSTTKDKGYTRALMVKEYE